jgi:hypothetical protein
LEALHKKKMVIDEAVSSSENDKNKFELLQVIYEKLVSFVSDKPNFKLRYFDDMLEGSDDQREEELDENVGRNSSIKSAYIQIKMEIEEIEPLEIFLKLSENSSNLLLTIQHEILPENGISSWLSGLETIENNSISFWIIPRKLQFDQNSEIFYEIFSILKQSLLIRNQLQNLIQDNFDLLEFDVNNPNEIFLLPLERNLKAKVSMNSIIWNWINETSVDIDFITSLNLIGSKYRSIIDCLQAQLEILKQ